MGQTTNNSLWIRKKLFQLRKMTFKSPMTNFSYVCRVKNRSSAITSRFLVTIKFQLDILLFTHVLLTHHVVTKKEMT